MTKLNIDSQSTNFDRCSAYKGAVANPLAAVPLVAVPAIAAEEDEIFLLLEKWENFKPVCNDILHRADVMDMALPRDYIMVFGSQARTHKELDAIIEHHTTPGMFFYEERKRKTKEELDNVLATYAKAKADCVGYDALMKQRDEALKHDEDLERAILTCRPTTHKGLAIKLRAINETDLDDTEDCMDQIILEIENFGRVS